MAPPALVLWFLAFTFASLNLVSSKECPKVHVPYRDYTPVELSSSVVGTENAMETEINLFTLEHHNNTHDWTLRFEFRATDDPRLSRVATVDVVWLKLHDQVRMACVKDKSHASVTFPWTTRLSVLTPPLVMKLQVGPAWIRISEVLEGGRIQTVGQHSCINDNLNIPNLELYATCIQGRCGSISSCKKGEPCNTIAVRSGICIPFASCQGLEEPLNNLSVPNFLKYYGCGFSDGTSRVCCPV